MHSLSPEMQIETTRLKTENLVRMIKQSLFITRIRLSLLIKLFLSVQKYFLATRNF